MLDSEILLVKFNFYASFLFLSNIHEFIKLHTYTYPYYFIHHVFLPLGCAKIARFTALELDIQQNFSLTSRLQNKPFVCLPPHISLRSFQLHSFMVPFFSGEL